MTALLEVENLNSYYGDSHILFDVSLQVAKNEVVALLRNIRRGRTLVVVEHDMDALFELAERITVLHEGAVLAEGTPAEIQRNSFVQEAYLGGVAAA